MSSTLQELSLKMDSFKDNLETLKENCQKQTKTFKELLQHQTKASHIETSLCDIDRKLKEEEIQGEFIQQQNKWLINKVDDLKNRERRSNITMFGLPERSEGEDILFLNSWLPDILDLKEGLSYGIEKVHRAIRKPIPSSSTSTPRSIVVQFLSYQDKELVLKSAWWKSPLKYKQSQIRFDNDYSSRVLEMRKKTWPLVKLLKQNKIKAQLAYPAKIRIFFFK